MAGNPPHQRQAEFEEVALPHLDALFNLAVNLTRNRKDKEISEALSIRLGTVMSRLHRGRKALQASLLEFARNRPACRRSGR